MASQYWDSCLFLAYLQNKPEERELVETISALLRRAESGDALTPIHRKDECRGVLKG